MYLVFHWLISKAIKGPLSIFLAAYQVASRQGEGAVVANRICNIQTYVTIQKFSRIEVDIYVMMIFSSLVLQLDRPQFAPGAVYCILRSLWSPDIESDVRRDSSVNVVTPQTSEPGLQTTVCFTLHWARSTSNNGMEKLHHGWLFPNPSKAGCQVSLSRIHSKETNVSPLLVWSWNNYLMT